MIKAIGFDCGGVIVGLSGPLFMQKASELLGVELKTLSDIYFKFNHLMNNGEVSREDFWKKIVQELNVEDRFDDLIKLTKETTTEINGSVLGLVDKLRMRGYKVGLLSNNTTDEAKRLEDIGLFGHFDVRIISSEVGMSKPDPRIFHLLIERLGIKPEELAFIDDAERSLSRASEVGFDPILFTDYDSLVRELNARAVTI
jgi:putative hydrolase of the HAD superfamily